MSGLSPANGASPAAASSVDTTAVRSSLGASMVLFTAWVTGAVNALTGAANALTGPASRLRADGDGNVSLAEAMASAARRSKSLAASATFTITALDRCGRRRSGTASTAPGTIRRPSAFPALRPEPASRAASRLRADGDGNVIPGRGDGVRGAPLEILGGIRDLHDHGAGPLRQTQIGHRVDCPGDDPTAVGLAGALTRAGKRGPRGGSRPGRLFELGPEFGPAVAESSPRLLHISLNALNGLSATLDSSVDLLANPVAQRRQWSRLRRTG